MGNRQRGDYLERQAKAALENRGWWVIRAAGSYGAADLVALRAHFEPLALSCKLNGRIGPAERNALLTVADKTGLIPVICSRRNRGFVYLEMLDSDGKNRHYLDELKVPARPGKETP